MTQQLLQRIALAVCLMALLLHVVAVRRDPLQLDEFEHLHAAWLVAHGQTPFVDFFEHHTPLFYYLGAVVIPVSATYDSALNMRFLALVFSFASVVAAWFWLRRLGPVHAWLGAAMVSTGGLLLEYGHITFLDTYSAPLLIISAALFAGGSRKPAWMAASGLFFGLAVLFNLKASMAMFAPILIALSRAWETQGNRAAVRAWLGDMAAYLAGGLLSIAFTAALLGPDGMAGMWQFTVKLNLGWKARKSGWPTYSGMLLRDLFVAASAAVFCGWRLLTLPGRRFVLDQRDTPWLFFASLTAGIFILPVVWMEYFVVLAPFLALTAAVALGDWMSSGLTSSTTTPDHRISLAVLCAFGLMALFPFRAVYRNDMLAVGQSALLLAAFFGLFLLLPPERLRLHLAICLSLVAALPLIRTATTLHRRDNTAQRAEVEYVMAHTSADDAVFDGYTGYGVFRPHAYFYWFLHQEVQAMLSEADKSDRLIAALQARRPKIVISDPWVATLPAPVQRHLAEQYEPTSHAALLRRKPSSAVLGGR